MRKSDLVDVFIGTAGSGKAIVGPQVPHGMVKLSPDTVSLPNGGYDYDDDSILGFSHTHIEGIGGSGGRGYIMLMPTLGEREFDQLKYMSPFSHDREHGEAGYYSVDLLRYGIKAELTATQCCSVQRYTFPKSDSSRIILDLTHTLNSYGIAYGGYINIISESSVSGWGKFPVMYPNSLEVQPYFYAELSKPFKKAVSFVDGEIEDNFVSGEAKRLVTALEFETEEGEEVVFRLGLSYISEEQAKKNLYAQVDGFDFDGTVEKCKQKWDEALSVIDIECDGETLMKVFYSDLYRSKNAPVDYTEEGGVYFVGSSETGEVRKSGDGRRYYSDMWAIWDTFRSTHSLQYLTSPEMQPDVAQSLIDNYYTSKTLPVSPAPCKGIVPCMIGHHAVSVIAEAYAKGKTGFDIQTAYEAVMSCVMRTDVGQLGIPKDYAEYGYMPSDGKNPETDHSVSETLELTYDDWCAAHFAQMLGKDEESKQLFERAKNYKNVFHPETGFVRRRLKDGSFIEPFNPNDSHKRGFCECTPWEYTTLVPHDIQGVINLMGGDELMVKHIDGVFENNRFNHINETAFHIPFIYTFARAPHKTMEVCRRYMPTVHKDGPGGLYGEDDSGAMSSWYAFIMLGLFSSCPAAPYYTLTSPAFKKWTLHLPEGKSFTVNAQNNSDENIYIRKAFLNGKPYNKAYLMHEDIVSGGELLLEMGSEPSDFATDFESAPPSMTKETPNFETVNVSGDKNINSGEVSRLTVRLKNVGADGSLEVKIMNADVLCGRRVCYLDSGTQADFDIEYVLYDVSTEKLSVNGTEFCVNVTPKEISDKLIFSDIKYDVPMHTDGECTFTVSCKVKNVSGYKKECAADCILDEEKYGTKTVVISSGEEKEVSFSVSPKGLGTHKVRIGESETAELDIAQNENTNKWIRFTSEPSEFYESGNNIYIKSAGSQHQYYKHFTNRMPYGMLFKREKVKGDFDAVVRIEYEEYTTPYAMHGIVIKNSLTSLREDCGGTILCGAMSSRGFINHAYLAERIEGERDFSGAPETPYFVRIKKEGKTFSCYYGKDGKDWTKTAVYNIESTADEQYVGLYVNSCVPEKRLVKFTDFNIKNKNV